MSSETKEAVLTWFVAVHRTLGVTPGVSTPEWGRQTPLAEGVETRQEFGLSVVEAQLADGTSVHESEGALLFLSLFLGGQTLRLVLHDNNNVVIVNVVAAFIHFFCVCFVCLFAVSLPDLSESTNQRRVTIGNKG